MAAWPARINYTIGSPTGIDREATTTLTVNKPASVTEGNLLLMQVVAAGTTNTISTPSGWTVAITTLNSTCRQTIFYKYAGASEANASVTVGSGAGTAQGAMIQVKDMRLTDPIDSNSASSTGNSTTPSAPAVTAGESNVYAIYLLGISYDDFSSVFTNMYDHSSSESSPGTIIAAQENITEHTTSISSYSFTTLDFAERWIGTTIVVRPVVNAVVGGVEISMGAAF